MNRDDFIESNLGLVHACAARFKGKGIEYDDLYSAGCVGLVKAVDNFDKERGLCFSTYAVPVILGEIRRLREFPQLVADFRRRHACHCKGKQKSKRAFYESKQNCKRI